MLIQLRNSFITIKRVHQFLYRPRFHDINLVQIIVGVLFISGGVLHLCFPGSPSREFISSSVGVILFLFIFIVLPFVYVSSILYRQEQGRTKNIDDHITFSTGQFLKFGANTSIVVMFSLLALFTGVLKIDISLFLPMFGECIIPLFFVIFSIIAILWFGFLIANDVFDLQYIKVRINQYIAWASVVSLLQFPFFKSIIASFGILLVASRFIVYCLEERVLEKKNENQNNSTTLFST